jgi:chromosome segregation ATPase
MAEMNDLLEQAIQECEGLTAEAGSFASELEKSIANASRLDTGVVGHARANLERLQQELTELKRLDHDGDQREDEFMERTAQREQELADREETASALLEKARVELQDLRQETARVAAALAEGSARARESLEQLEARLSELEETAETRLEQAEEAVEAVEAAVRDAMDRFHDAQVDVEERLADAQDAARARVEELLSAYGKLRDGGAALADDVADIVEDVSGRTAHTVEAALAQSLPHVLDALTGDLFDLMGGDAVAHMIQGGREEVTAGLQIGLQAFARMAETMAGSVAMMHDAEMAVIRNIG